MLLDEFNEQSVLQKLLTEKEEAYEQLLAKYNNLKKQKADETKDIIEQFTRDADEKHQGESNLHKHKPTMLTRI